MFKSVAERNKFYRARKALRYGAASLASRRAAVANTRRSASVYIPRSIKGEIKCVDVGYNTYALNSTGAITAINLVRAGSSFFNRIGRKINMKSLHLKAQLIPLRTVAASDYVRVMIVYDAQSNGNPPAIADILQDTDQAGTNSTNAASSANLNNRDRFKIICDYRICVPSLTLTAGVLTNPGIADPIEPLIDIERYIKLKSLVTQYKADSSPAVIGDVATGGLFLVTLGGIVAGTEGWQLGGSLRLRYFDQ